MAGPIVLSFYFGILVLLSMYGLHRYWILYLYWRHYKSKPPLLPPPPPAVWPRVTVQLPLFNERYVLERLLNAAAALDYPRDRLEIQVLDDSTDDSRLLAERCVQHLRDQGVPMVYLSRSNRRGFKAGALAEGLKTATGEFIAIFDADFLPPADFLKKTIPHFADRGLGLVQTRWGHLNSDYSLLTRLQTHFLDGHFMLEHTARNRSGSFFNFNGTAGVWRRATIDDAGGWSDDTLTEDLDISYRAQMKGWRFLFLPEVVCPAELPVDMGAFRNQQHRWTKGALQVGRKILPALWKAPLPLRVKVESTVHLTSNVAYFLVLILALLLFPALVARYGRHWPLWANAVEFVAFSLTTFSVVLFYAVAHKEVSGGHPRFRWRDFPALMGLGVGMCVNNSRAVLEALLNIKSEFVRTAKFNIRTRKEPWKKHNYRHKRPRGGGEMALGFYLAMAFVWSIMAGHYTALPFLALFLGGFLYVGVLSLRHALHRR